MKEKKDSKIIPNYFGLQGPFNGLGLADPLGSYTGVPVIPDEEPVQDADDL